MNARFNVSALAACGQPIAAADHISGAGGSDIDVAELISAHTRRLLVTVTPQPPRRGWAHAATGERAVAWARRAEQTGNALPACLVAGVPLLDGGAGRCW